MQVTPKGAILVIGGGLWLTSGPFSVMKVGSSRAGVAHEAQLTAAKRENSDGMGLLIPRSLQKATEKVTQLRLSRSYECPAQERFIFVRR
mmetsp:Transcript_80455/g.139639  ORF Transcript_80455/g.139639 Transcript_80455/m.139639 type:complete len:90 (+) Transcript_80455:247-516(+)